MIRRGLSFALAVSLVSFGLGAIAAQQDKVHLSRKARVGDVSRTLTEATMSAGMDGLMMTMNVKEIDKVTITAVADDGAITARTEAELAEVSVGGQTRPSPPQDPITIVLRPDGSVVSYGDQGFGAIAARMHSGTHIVFAEKPVGVGDSWTRAIKADPATGAPAANAEYKIVAFEKVGEIHTARIAFSFRELGNDPIAVNGTTWVETSTGDEVKSEYELRNLTISPGLLANAAVKVTRK
jgi:hypothetical protein